MCRNKLSLAGAGRLKLMAAPPSYGSSGRNADLVGWREFFAAKTAVRFVGSQKSEAASLAARVALAGNVYCAALASGCLAKVVRAPKTAAPPLATIALLAAKPVQHCWLPRIALYRYPV